MSWTSLLLARAGFKPIVYDFDLLEEHNISGQLHRYSDAKRGVSKVESIANTIKDYCDEDILTKDEEYTLESGSDHYVFSCFDNMKARKEMFESWCAYVDFWKNDTDEDKNESTPIFIDGRLSAESMQIFCVTPNEIESYKEYLFEDSEVEDLPCTFKQTSHAAAMIASHIVGFFTNHINNQRKDSIKRNIPFYWEYIIPLDFINRKDGVV